MNELIEENGECADKKNHGYLCNLFSCLALVMMLEGEGESREESERIAIEAMHRFVEPSTKSMRALARMPFFVRMLNLLMPIKFRRVTGYGWDIEFPKGERKRFAMTTHRCLFFEIFSKYGRPELMKGFCQVDNILYGALPKTKFSYTERIGEGAGHLCKVESLIKKHNDTAESSIMRLPSFKMVLTGGKFGIKRPDGVLVVPIGCLKD